VITIAYSKIINYAEFPFLMLIIRIKPLHFYTLTNILSVFNLHKNGGQSNQVYESIRALDNANCFVVDSIQHRVQAIILPKHKTTMDTNPSYHVFEYYGYCAFQ
jgi:hypothetical protein